MRFGRLVRSKVYRISIIVKNKAKYYNLFLILTKVYDIANEIADIIRIFVMKFRKDILDLEGEPNPAVLEYIVNGKPQVKLPSRGLSSSYEIITDKIISITNGIKA